ncbi:hypothetical protein CK203_015181 [Vitis vinifera]|uniref:Uncharacterized protein n=1 Tax=Vitis vinifera TaxID=29760 RepID=A0A438JD65_VITVI|nr:hypothetical protein CK203_015181 [Vitis vinifera]
MVFWVHSPYGVFRCLGTLKKIFGCYRFCARLQLQYLTSKFKFQRILRKNSKFNKKIPTDNQFQTLIDPSIYQGNLALCGFPLAIECHDNNGTIPIGKGEDNDDEDGDDFELSWFFVSMGLGFIIGFWGVCGTLIIKTSWRYAYFHFVEKMKDRLILVVALNVARLARKV